MVEITPPRRSLGRDWVSVSPSRLTPEMWQRAALAADETKFLELRLDSLAFPGLKDFLAAHRDVTAIATSGCKEAGGHFRPPYRPARNQSR